MNGRSDRGKGPFKEPLESLQSPGRPSNARYRWVPLGEFELRFRLQVSPGFRDEVGEQPDFSQCFSHVLSHINRDVLVLAAWLLPDPNDYEFDDWGGAGALIVLEMVVATSRVILGLVVQV